MNLSITNECNRRCEYCFQKEWYLSSNSNSVKEMSLETVEQIIKMMTDDIKHLKLLGGEPLLHSNLFDILDVIKFYGKTATMISNITVEKEKLERIMIDYDDVVTSWLINTDFPNSHREQFLDNITLFKDYERISLSTTLLPNTEKILESADRILDILEVLSNREDIRIRVSPMSPNHKDDIFYDYTLDIIKFIERIWSKGLRNISFDCVINACEIHPELIDMFERNEYLEYKNHQCRGCGPFDILVDNSVIYCSSTYNTIRLENIFDYKTIKEAEDAMTTEWRNYWKTHQLSCNYKNCNHFNPAYCQGLCPAKNSILLKKLK